MIVSHPSWEWINIVIIKTKNKKLLIKELKKLTISS